MLQKVKDFLVVSVWGNIEKIFNTTVTRIHEIYDGILAMFKHVLSDHKILLWTALGVLIVVVALNLGAAILLIRRSSHKSGVATTPL